MTYDVASVRLWSAQTAQRIFTEVAEGRNSSTSSDTSGGGSLADLLFAESEEAESEDDSKLAALIASLRRQAETGTVAAAEADEGTVDDLSSIAFMKALREKLETLRESESTSAMATAMLQAVAQGTLTVTNAASGEEITAWDAYSETATPTQAKAIEVTDWTSYLKEHLERDNTGRYERNADSSHKDKLTGASSYFGMIGETHYYLSWKIASSTVK